MPFKKGTGKKKDPNIYQPSKEGLTGGAFKKGMDIRRLTNDMNSLAGLIDTLKELQPKVLKDMSVIFNTPVGKSGMTHATKLRAIDMFLTRVYGKPMDWETLDNVAPEMTEERIRGMSLSELTAFAAKMEKEARESREREQEQDQVQDFTKQNKNEGIRQDIYESARSGSQDTETYAENEKDYLEH